LNTIAKFPPTPFANSFWIEPGRLLAGEYPGEAGAAATAARLNALIGAGVTYFIDLTRFGELPPYDHLLPQSRAGDDRYIIYVRKAILDHGVPASPQAMADTLDYLERAIEVGHQVYVHCRAGIGRTNTVVGCWLRRRGLSGHEALERLNELWRGNARAASWPRVPETAEQESYVLDWREPGEPAADEPAALIDLDAARALRDRYLGGMLGLACGDALGATLQFRLAGQFTPVGDLQAGGHWQLPLGAWTDDTALTLCVADSLLAAQGVDAADQLRRFREWQQSGRQTSTGQAVGISSAMAGVLAGAAPSLAGTAEPLARAGAAVLFGAATPQAVFPAVEACIGVTHRSPMVLSAGRLYASLLLAAVRGANRSTLLQEARALRRAAGAEELVPEIRRLADAPGYPEAPAAAGGPGVAPGPGAASAGALLLLQTLLWALASTSGFREGLLRLVNLGGDSDVRGALYGQLAGVLFGVGGIPRGWKSALLRRELLEDTADRLLTAALAPQE